MTQAIANDEAWMRRALELARRGEGWVEPNPMVGCVIVKQGRVLGEGWHQRFGERHAETEALSNCRETTQGATAYVTLEPCCHQGKQPPCTGALRTAGIERVVVATLDPFPQVSGQGVAELRQAGCRVEVGLLAAEADALNAPFRKRVLTGQPWVIAKWASTLDGKIATHRGDSQWISNAASRAIVHRLRGRCDAVMVGSGTARHDNPRLDARPPGPRVAKRVVFDTQASLDLGSRLVTTAREIPVIVACHESAEPARCQALEEAGVEVWRLAAATHRQRLGELLTRMGDAGMTNVLVEGGGHLLGTCFDARAIDEVHVFVAPKLVGGRTSPVPLLGFGVSTMSQAVQVDGWHTENVAGDAYLSGRLVWPEGLHEIPDEDYSSSN